MAIRWDSTAHASWPTNCSRQTRHIVSVTSTTRPRFLLAVVWLIEASFQIKVSTKKGTLISALIQMSSQPSTRAILAVETFPFPSCCSRLGLTQKQFHRLGEIV